MSSDNHIERGNGGGEHKDSESVRSSVREGTFTQTLDPSESRFSNKISSRWENIQKKIASTAKNFFVSPDKADCKHLPNEYNHVFRRKSRWEQIKLSGAVCGIEFCYAAETAFVTPILLNLGLSIKYVTIIWCLSPLVGLILSPILGSLSDSCESKYGRRRPFIIMYSIGIILGLILVPTGHQIGLALGDKGHEYGMDLNSVRTMAKVKNMTTNVFTLHKNSTASMQELLTTDNNSFVNKTFLNISNNTNFNNNLNISLTELDDDQVLLDRISDNSLVPNNPINLQPWSIVFTVIGVVLLDFCADACQSPARTYLLDVSIPKDHASGLSTFTIMAGLGGSLGYAMGAINWDGTFIGYLLDGQIHAVFTINSIIFLVCLVVSLNSLAEIPLPLLRDPLMNQEYQEKMHLSPDGKSGKEIDVINTKTRHSISFKMPNETDKEQNLDSKNKCEKKDSFTDTYKKSLENYLNENTPYKNNCKALKPRLSVEINMPVAVGGTSEPKLKDFLKSIVEMPSSLRILCLTNLFGWMSTVCYCLYFTDFVGESVFGGDPAAPQGSPNYEIFEDGVQFGCWGLALFCIACAFYSLFVEALVKRVGAKAVYIGGQLTYSMSTIIMAITKHRVAVILLSPTAGIMYSTILTLPYLLIADYHSKNQFSKKKKLNTNTTRGMGTDVAAVSSMMFLAQFCLSVSMGNIEEAIGSSAVPIYAAALLSACGALSAFHVTYLNN